MLTVIDAIMGLGKTNYMINRMNQLHAQSLSQSFSDPTHQSPRFIYVAPILSEVERIKKACPDLAFRDPQPVGGKKAQPPRILSRRGSEHLHHSRAVQAAQPRHMREAQRSGLHAHHRRGARVRSAL